jgi:hypothetical protein
VEVTLMSLDLVFLNEEMLLERKCVMFVDRMLENNSRLALGKAAGHFTFGTVTSYKFTRRQYKDLTLGNGLGKLYATGCECLTI